MATATNRKTNLNYGVSAKQKAYKLLCEFESLSNSNTVIQARDSQGQLIDPIPEVDTRLSTGQIVQSYFLDLSKIVDLTWFMTTSRIDLATFNYLPNLESLFFSQSKLININLIKSINPKIKIVRLTNGFQVGLLSDFEDLKDIEELNLFTNNFSGTAKVFNWTKIRLLDLSNNNFSQADLDDLVEKLYLAGDTFTGTGKILTIGGQLGNARASGVEGDPVSANNGQGFITGLIQEYNWTVIQTSIIAG